MSQAVFEEVLSGIQSLPPEARAKLRALLNSPVRVGEADEQNKFRRLAEQWLRETAHTSSLKKACMHPAYQRIIGMGIVVVPYLLRELEQRPDHWFWALNAITEEDPAQRRKIRSRARRRRGYSGAARKGICKLCRTTNAIPAWNNNSPNSVPVCTASKAPAIPSTTVLRLPRTRRNTSGNTPGRAGSAAISGRRKFAAIAWLITSACTNFWGFKFATRPTWRWIPLRLQFMRTAMRSPITSPDKRGGERGKVNSAFAVMILSMPRLNCWKATNKTSMDTWQS